MTQTYCTEQIKEKYRGKFDMIIVNREILTLTVGVETKDPIERIYRGTNVDAINLAGLVLSDVTSDKDKQKRQMTAIDQELLLLTK